MRLGAAGWWVTTCLVASPVAAHTPAIDRELVIQIDDRGLVSMWRTVMRGQQAGLVALAWDLDRDGQLGEAERVGAAAALLGRLAGSIELSYAGVPRRPANWQTRLETSAAGSALLVAEGLAELGTVSSDGELRVAVPAGGLAVSVSVQAFGAWRLSGAGVATDERGLQRAVRLGAGETMRIHLIRSPSNAGGR